MPVEKINPIFEILETVIRPETLRESLLVPSAGGFVSFEGWVRNTNEGKVVERLEYEAYAALAVKEGMLILQEAMERFEILGVRAAHRAGLLEIGGLAVWVGVVSRHRGPAFEASRYVIDEIKSRVPIWKREHYQGAKPEWVRCHHAH